MPGGLLIGDMNGQQQYSTARAMGMIWEQRKALQSEWKSFEDLQREERTRPRFLKDLLELLARTKR